MFKPVIVASTLTLASLAHAQSTAFTYQGELKSAGQPATGLHDIRVRLFDVASGGLQLGTTQCIDNVSVIGGLFVATIDFGQQFATPTAKFLEIEVRRDTGLTCANITGYTVMGSRQALTATPLANHAKSAFALDAADGLPTNAVFVDNAGKVGIGTTSPTHTVHVAATGPILTLQDTDSDAQQVGYVSLRNNANIERGWMGYGDFTNPHMSFMNIRSSGNTFLGTQGFNRLTISATGNVGIGTVTPTQPLQVAFDLPTVIIQDTGSNSTQSGYVGFWNSGGAETAWMGFGTPGSPHLTIFNARSGGNIVIDPGPGAAVQVPVLEITGADLAEKFPASEPLEPGTVVAIDRANAGKLCVSRGTYNRCVAGVVSGANNFAAGAVLGNLPGHEDAPAIALSGRVYVWCDAASGVIEPGDLLTTSDTPGHAMKATDRDRSHGTVIGKAMERLESGRGLVLVLVNLQ